MSNPAEDLAQELAEDALLDKAPIQELPAWPGNALAGGTADGTPLAPRRVVPEKEEKP